SSISSSISSSSTSSLSSSFAVTWRMLFVYLDYVCRTVISAYDPNLLARLCSKNALTIDDASILDAFLYHNSTPVTGLMGQMVRTVPCMDSDSSSANSVNVDEYDNCSVHADPG